MDKIVSKDSPISNATIYRVTNLYWFRSPFHSNMITVIGTLSIFLVGLGASRILGRKRG